VKTPTVNYVVKKTKILCSKKTSLLKVPQNPLPIFTFLIAFVVQFNKNNPRFHFKPGVNQSKAGVY